MTTFRSVVAAVSVIASSAHLVALVEGNRWLISVTALTAGIFLITTTVRLLASKMSPWLGPVLSGCFAAWFICWSVVPASLLLGVFPTRATFSALKVDAELAATTITDSPPPVTDNPGIILTILTAVAGISLLVDHAVSEVSSPALSGLFLLALWTPALLLDIDVPVALLVIAVLTWLILLTTSREWTTDALYRLGATTWVLIVASAVVIVAMTVVVPRLGEHPWWEALSRDSAGLKDSATTVAIPNDLELRHHLEDRSTVAMLRYRSEDHNPDILRLKVMDTFKEGRWEPATNAEKLEPLSDDFYLNGDTDDTLKNLEGSPTKIHVEYTRLTEEFAAMPGPLLGMQPSQNAWRINTTTKELYAPNTVSAPYTLIWDSSAPTSEQLSSATTNELANSRWAKLDEPLPTSLAEVLPEARGDAQTSYEVATNIQNWFRNDANFSYSVTNDELSEDALADFMSTRTGFCVHYATAMTLMLREEGIPARVAVGFLPGTSAGNDWYHVAPDRTHAWPEVYFDSFGWVRFEPTPSAQTGAAPPWTLAESSNEDAATDQENEEPEPTPTEEEDLATDEVEPSESPSSQQSFDINEQTFNTTKAMIALCAAIVAALGLAATWWWLRVRRKTGHELDVSARIWRDAREVVRSNFAEVGQNWEVSTTPAQVQSYVAPRLPQASAEALDELASAIAASAYGFENTVTDSELERLLTVFKHTVELTPHDRG